MNKPQIDIDFGENVLPAILLGVFVGTLIKIYLFFKDISTGLKYEYLTIITVTSLLTVAFTIFRIITRHKEEVKEREKRMESYLEQKSKEKLELEERIKQRTGMSRTF